MEEKRKKKRVRNQSEKGQWFQDLDTFTDAQRSMIVEWYAYAMKYADTEIERRKKAKEMIPSFVIRDASVAALLYCVSRWNPDGGCNFKTYFHTGFFFQVNHAVNRYVANRDKYISENKTASNKCKYLRSADHKGFPTLEETDMFAQCSFEDSVIGNMFVEELLSNLDDFHRMIVQRCCIDLEKQTDIAKDLGVTRQYIHQELSLAKKKLKFIMEKKMGVI